MKYWESRAHLFFLQDDFLLQHFDGVEFVVSFELGEQDLHGGLFVSGLFGKHSAPPSRNTAVKTLQPQTVETDDTEKSERYVDTKKKSLNR